LFENNITFVCVDGSGVKTNIQKPDR